MNAINFSKDNQQIITLTMDLPGKSANILNRAFGESLAAAVEKIKADNTYIGIIITSAKDTFMAGADIDELFAESSAAYFFEGAEKYKAALRWIELQGKPVVAAINGTALGGGLELALACHHRIAIDNDKIQIGLPEVTLGLLPGGGGIVRMTRMLGLQPSLPLLTEGKKLKPKAAVSIGIINELAADRADLLTKAKAYILANKTAKQPWDSDSYKMPGGNAVNPKVAAVLPIAPAMLAKKTWNNYPAPLAIMAAAVEGSVVDFDTASRIESRYFAAVATSNVAKNMITTFWTQLNSLNAGGSRPAIAEKFSFKKVGVIGAGMMGSGIAFACAASGIQVVLKDVSVEAAEKGKAYSESILKKRISQGKSTKEKAAAILALITPTTDAADFAECDLIIEAVFENRQLKAAVTKEAEATMDASGVFASNTSTLPITGLAEKSMRPNQFIGLHFFSPADKMPLVEIIVGKQTDDVTLARAFDFVKQIKKTPIVVNDSRGFYTSRVFATYVLEGIAILGEGNNAMTIERAGLQAGMPVGPLALTDEVSISLIDHIRKQTKEDLAIEGIAVPEHPAYTVVDTMVTTAKRLGKAAGGGFYDYPENGKKQLWSGLQSSFPEKTTQLPQQEMIDRLLFIQCIETVRCLEEGILRNVADANIGSVFGWGFAPFKGGTLQFINDYGVAAFVAKAHELHQHYGQRFAVPALLLKMAKAGEQF